MCARACTRAGAWIPWPNYGAVLTLLLVASSRSFLHDRWSTEPIWGNAHIYIHGRYLLACSSRRRATYPGNRLGKGVCCVQHACGGVSVTSKAVQTRHHDPGAADRMRTCYVCNGTTGQAYYRQGRRCGRPSSPVCAVGLCQEHFYTSHPWKALIDSQVRPSIACARRSKSSRTLYTCAVIRTYSTPSMHFTGHSMQHLSCK